MEVKQLTDEEVSGRHLFIGECVDKNIALPTATIRFGVNQNLTVQDLCNSNVETLKAIGKSIKAAEEKHGDDEFEEDGKDLKLGGISASRWRTFIKLTIQKKLWESKQEKEATHIKKLKAELAQLETPQERKAKIEKELAAYES